jgi:hypothetical protein
MLTYLSLPNQGGTSGARQWGNTDGRLSHVNLSKRYT